MENFNLIPALLCIFCWIPVSRCDVRTVELLPGEEVTMSCSNLTDLFTHIFWFRLANTEFNITRISSMLGSDGNVTLYAGFENRKFRMTSESSHIFLNIKPVDSSDFGLYFCGHYMTGGLVIFNTTYLKIEEMIHESRNPTCMLLGGLTIFLIMIIIALLVKIRIFYTAQDKRRTPQNTQNEESDGLNYAAVGFQHRPNGGRRSTVERELEPHVVYAATR